MGSKNVYMSNIMASVDEHLAQAVAALANVVTNLQIVNASVSANLDTLTVGSGNENYYQAITAETISVVGDGTDGVNKTSIGKVKMLCNGVVTVYASMDTDAALYQGGLWMQRNAGAWEKLATVTAQVPTPELYSADISVSYGDVIEFAIGGYENGKHVYSVNGISLSYNIMNIAQTGAFAEV
jgi:hypothetical protein